MSSFIIIYVPIYIILLYIREYYVFKLINTIVKQIVINFINKHFIQFIKYE